MISIFQINISTNEYGILSFKPNIFYYAGCILKSSGFLKLSYKYFSWIITIKRYEYWALLGLADLLHLSFIWSLQYKSLEFDSKRRELEKLLDKEYVIHHKRDAQADFHKALEFYQRALCIKPRCFYTAERISELY